MLFRSKYILQFFILSLYSATCISVLILACLASQTNKAWEILLISLLMLMYVFDTIESKMSDIKTSACTLKIEQWNITMDFFTLLFILYSCMYGTHVPQYTWRGLRTAFRFCSPSLFSSSQGRLAHVKSPSHTYRYVQN